MHRRPEGRSCSHTAYLLSCEEYDELWKHAQGRCELCGTRPEDTPQKVLCVDHDWRVGQWAVRGLLCHRCNVTIEVPGREPAGTDRYLAEPWYQVLLDRAGITGTTISEPPVGSEVKALSPRPYGGWFWYYRTEKGWHLSAKYPPLPITWERLCYVRGPHRIVVVSRGRHRFLPYEVRFRPAGTYSGCCGSPEDVRPRHSGARARSVSIGTR